MPDRTSPIFAYLHHVQQKLNISASQLAKMSGIAPSTITRFMSSDSYKYVPSLTTIGKIAKATGIDPAPFMSTKNYADRSIESFFKGEIDANLPKELFSTVVIGEADATVARAALLVEEIDFTPLPITYNLFSAKDCFAAVMRGGNINKYVQDGEILYCLRAEAATFAIQDKSIVLIERTVSEDMRFIELSARIVSMEGEKFILSHASTDTKFKEELETDGSLEGEGFKIIGVVNFVLRDVPQYQLIIDT